MPVRETTYMEWKAIGKFLTSGFMIKFTLDSALLIGQFLKQTGGQIVSIKEFKYVYKGIFAENWIILNQ